MQRAPDAFDVAVIGAGIIGLAVAYRLAKSDKRVVVLEKEADAGLGVTAGQANVIHVVQLPFGSMKSRLARKGNAMYDDLCRELEVGLKRMPALLVVRGWLRLPVLFAGFLYPKFGLRGQFRVQLMRGSSLRRIEPLLADDLFGGIVVHGYGTVDARSLVTKLKEASEALGAVFRFNSEVSSAQRVKEATLLRTTAGEVRAKFVVNAAGLYSDDISRMLGRDFGRLEPGLGAMAVYSGLGVRTIVAPLPLNTGPRTKGEAIIPATDGTTIMGPTLRIADSKKDRSHTNDDLNLLNTKFGPLLKAQGELVRVYTGVRPLSPNKDFIIDFDRASRVISLVGIESPGLTASPAIAELVGEMVAGEEA